MYFINTLIVYVLNKPTSAMKVLRYSLLLAMVVTCNMSFCQLAIIDYMRVPPQKESNYLELERLWKKVHAERLKVGTIKSWYLYKVRYSGTESDYQYVVVTMYNTFDDSENLYFEGVFDKAWKNLNQDSIFNYSYATRELVKSEVFVFVDGTEIKFNDPPKYFYMNYIKVPQGEENNYQDIEKYIWKPIHVELQKERKLASWSLWNLWFYSHRDYQYLTMNAFYEYQDIDSYNYSETFQKIHQGKDLNTMFKNTDEARESVKTELWELVDFVAK